jgi:DNA-binding LacI/PurR family transcriptional regulator
MDQKPATIKEIAKRLNVSVSTVSRALHNHPSIGLRTKTQVQKLAEELNYEPNQAAISFKQGKTYTIGVLLPNLREEFFSIAINGIEDVCANNNYTVLIGQSHDDTDREKKIVETMRKHRVDGILASVATTSSDYSHFEQLDKYKIPIVFFDRVPAFKDAYTVSCSLRGSSTEMVDWLIQNGHQRIGFIKGIESLDASQERLDGYLEGLKKNSIKVENTLIVQTNLTRVENETAMQKLLSLKKRPTAVIAFNDYVALDVIKYTRGQGLKINKDIFFVSYANLPITSYLDEPLLVSVEQYPYEQAEKAAEILIRLINSKGQPVENIERKVILESKLIVHDSFR